MAKKEVILETGTVADFFARVLEHAKKLDRGEKLEPEPKRVTFEDPADLARALARRRSKKKK